MRIKKLPVIQLFTSLACFLVIGQGCSKYNEPVPLEFPELKPKVGSPEYYKALRAYKKSKHSISFAWWGGSGVESIGPNMASRYEGLPDSIDIVSLWGGIPKNPEVMAELQAVREKKGTQFVIVMFGSGVNRLMDKNDSLLSITDPMAAIDNVAKAIADTVKKYNLDGFDLDYEPGYGDKSIFGDSGGTITDDPHTQRLFKALSQYFGPMSGTDKLLIIDGQSDVGIIPYIDYHVQQTYGVSNAGSLQSRFSTYGGGNILPSEKFVVTENMQGNGAFGKSFIYNGVNIGSLAGMAYWNPIQGRKGGFGAYLLEYDALSNPNAGYYYNFRKGIQIQNPALY